MTLKILVIVLLVIFSILTFADERALNTGGGVYDNTASQAITSDKADDTPQQGKVVTEVISDEPVIRVSPSAAKWELDK